MPQKESRKLLLVREKREAEKKEPRSSERMPDYTYTVTGTDHMSCHQSRMRRTWCRNDISGMLSASRILRNIPRGCAFSTISSSIANVKHLSFIYMSSETRKRSCHSDVLTLFGDMVGVR